MSPNRRYDIDWLRVIAIGLLLIYHVAIGFQAWGMMIGFITSDKTWESLWIPMSMLNVWRIPLLFFVSGMGTYFAIQNRNWKQLLSERAGRIGVPYLFGFFVIVPVHLFILQKYYHWDLNYIPNPGHLWFLGNIFVYVVVLLPVFFYLKNNERGRLVESIKKLLSKPWGLLLVLAIYAAEAIVVDPHPYEMYAMTWHGFMLGLLAFFFGFFFVLSGSGFWNMILQWRWIFLGAAASLFGYRLGQGTVPNYQLAVESFSWIISVLAFGYRYLNHPGKALSYLSQAAYPIYILHMIFIYLGSTLIFPLELPAPVSFLLVLIFTVAGCFAIYELIVRRVRFIRPLFGLKNEVKDDREGSMLWRLRLSLRK